MKNYTHYLVIDLEATCDKKGFSRHEMEIIEIGAVLVDSDSLEPIKEFQSFIRPVRNPELTPFCTELTSITQGDVDTAPLFPEVMKELKAEMLQGGYILFCSWGGYDRNQFLQDCEYHNITYPFGDHLNLKVAFSERQGLRKKFGMKGALRRMGIPLDGTHHRGIDDARNIAKLLPYCL